MAKTPDIVPKIDLSAALAELGRATKLLGIMSEIGAEVLAPSEPPLLSSKREVEVANIANQIRDLLDAETSA